MSIEHSNRSTKLHVGHYVRYLLRSDPSVFQSRLDSPGVLLRPKDSPALTDPAKQKIYRYFVAKLQFVAPWIRFDISFAVSQLARFCA